MSELKQLTPQDALFIGGETANVYQHTGGLLLLDGSSVPGYGFDNFRRHMETHISGIPQFRWKLSEVPLGLDLPYWVEDERFSFDNHIRRIAVPSPGDEEALAEVVSYLYCRHLDRRKPLWELWFIEGLADGRYAVMQKMHHCIMDGEGATRLAELMWDTEPDAALPKLDAMFAGVHAGDPPQPWQKAFNSARHLSALPFRAGREVYEVASDNLTRRLRGGGKSRQRPVTPETCFNRDIGAERHLVFGSLSLQEIKAVKRRFKVTVNDVLLALVAGSMRDYLQALDELPGESLRTSIAVSLRSEDDDEFSNHVTTTSVTLATDIDDPVERLLAIAGDATRAKEEAHHGGKGVMEFIQLLTPAMITAMFQLTPADKIAAAAGSNLIVSNVRGSEEIMYIGGARVDAVYPMSIIMPGGGINVTCLSYGGQVHFGITVEPNLVPQPWRIIDALQATLKRYTSRRARKA